MKRYWHLMPDVAYILKVETKYFILQRLTILISPSLLFVLIHHIILRKAMTRSTMYVRDALWAVLKKSICHKKLLNLIHQFYYGESSTWRKVSGKTEQRNRVLSWLPLRSPYTFLSFHRIEIKLLTGWLSWTLELMKVLWHFPFQGKKATNKIYYFGSFIR